MKNRGEQWIDWHAFRYYKEVYWLDWQESECGRAWEQTIFGGHIAPINNKIDGSHGIGISDWPPQGVQKDPERRVWNTVSMRYVEKLFQMNTWQRPYSLRDWRVFNIPRDGATSLYINSFTTMLATEEQRVAKEEDELAEAIALANAQPAKKKRVKANGRMEEQRAKDEKVIEEAVIESEQQPRSPKRQVPNSDGQRRASSPGALPGQRLILSPHIRRPTPELTSIPNHSLLPPLPPPRPTQTPLTSDPSVTVDTSPEIYPKHSECSTIQGPKEPTSDLIKRLKRQPTGLMDAFRQRRRIRLATKEADAKRKRDLADATVSELQECLIRESELREQLAAAKRDLRTAKESAEAERRRALADKAEVEARERSRRKNRRL